jgi:hypothetical protein
MTIFLRRILAVVLCLAAAGALSAQSYETFQVEWARVTEKFVFRLGPFRAFPAFEVRRLGYGDNVYFEDKPARDFTATIAPSLTFYLPLRRRAIFYIRESPEYTYYARESRLREFTNGFAGGGKLLLFNRFVVSGEYRHQSRLQAVSSELGRPARGTVDAASGAVFYETARRTSIGLTGSIARMTYDDISWEGGEIYLASLLNRTERNAALEVYYRIGSDARWFATAGATEYRFAAASSGRDASSIQFTTGLKLPLIGPLAGMVSLGYKAFEPRAEGREAFSGIIADSQVEARMGRFAVRAGARRDLRFSYFEDALFFIEDSLAAGGSFYPAGFVRLDYGYEQGRMRYPGLSASGASAGGGDAGPRVDRQQTHAAALVFRVLKTSGLGLQLAYERWTSNVPGWDRERTFAGLYLTTRF